MIASREGRQAGRPTLGAHVLLWALDSSTSEIEKAIAAAHALGLDFVQVSLSSLEIDVAAVRESLRRHAMGCLTGLAVPWNVWEVVAEATSITS